MEKHFLYILLLCFISCGENSNYKQRELDLKERELRLKEKEFEGKNGIKQTQTQEQHPNQHPNPPFQATKKYLSYNHNGSGVYEYLFINQNGIPFYHTPKRGTFIRMEATMNISMTEAITREFGNKHRIFKFDGDNNPNNIYALVLLPNENILCVDNNNDRQTYIQF